jgi:hypothetical protein
MPEIASGEILLLPRGRHKISAYYGRQQVYNEEVRVTSLEVVNLTLGGLRK